MSVFPSLIIPIHGLIAHYIFVVANDWLVLLDSKCVDNVFFFLLKEFFCGDVWSMFLTEIHLS